MRVLEKKTRDKTTSRDLKFFIQNGRFFISKSSLDILFKKEKNFVGNQTFCWRKDGTPSQDLPALPALPAQDLPSQEFPA